MLNMKIDIVRAWKDEAYRHSLDKGTQEELLAHPSGELSDADLLQIMGGDGGGGYTAPTVSHDSAGAAAVSTTNNGRSCTSTHSWGLLCDINFYSKTLSIIAIDYLIDIGNTHKQTCVEGCF